MSSGSILLVLLGVGSGQDLPIDSLPAVLPTEPPHGFELIQFVADGASEEVVALGRALFFDPILSVDRTVSCASCHRPGSGFADPKALSTGVRGQLTERNAPALLNRGLGSSFMWDGRAPTLEEQVLQPIDNPVEMGLGVDDALSRLASSELYRPLFGRAFGSALLGLDILGLSQGE